MCFGFLIIRTFSHFLRSPCLQNITDVCSRLGLLPRTWRKRFPPDNPIAFAVLNFKLQPSEPNSITRHSFVDKIAKPPIKALKYYKMPLIFSRLLQNSENILTITKLGTNSPKTPPKSFMHELCLVQKSMRDSCTSQKFFPCDVSAPSLVTQL